jgi:phage terminase large subunit GpA-like protein
VNARPLILPGHPGSLRLVARTLANAIRPPEPLPFSKWLPQNIVLIDGEHAGELWSSSGAPYLTEIADCLSDDHPCNLVTVRKSQQSGASILALAWCLYIADREPANILYGMPNIDALREMNSQKLQPLIDAWHKQIKRSVIYPQTSRSSIGSTTYEKKFNGGYLALANANAVMDLSSKTIRKGVKDEVSKWQEIPGYGDPEDLFFGRFTAFRRTKSWKILEISTPEVDSGDEDADAEGHCRIDRSFRRSDKRFWHCICPECRKPFRHDVERLRIDAAHPHRTKYECGCGHLITETERVIGLKSETGAHWKPTASEHGRHPGFHVDAFISMMMSYEAIAEDSLKAKTEIEKKGFNNLVLGLPHKYRGDAPDHERLLKRVEAYLKRGHVPPRGLIVTAFADIQMRGIWLEIVAHAPNRETWCIDAMYIDGDTSDPHGFVFQQLKRETLDREFPDAFGKTRTIDALAVDSGYRANVVYSFVRNNQRVHPLTGKEMILATKGLKGWGRPALGQPSLVDIDLDGKKITQGAKVWGVGTWPLKVTVYSDLRQELPSPPLEPKPPDGYCHFGSWCDENYFKQLTAEQLEDIKFRGRTTSQKWVKLRENHFHDCRVGNTALGDYLGLSSTTPEQWAALAHVRGLPPEMTEVTLFTPRKLAPTHDSAHAEAEIAKRKARERVTAPPVKEPEWLNGYDVKL